MWRLIKAEIKYMARLTVLIYAASIAIALALPWLTKYNSDYYNPGSEFWEYAMMLFFAVTFGTVFSFLSTERVEARLRGMMVLPVQKTSIAVTRIIMPLIICLIYAFLMILCALLLSFGYPRMLPDSLEKAILPDMHYTGYWIVSLLFILNWGGVIIEAIGRITLITLLIVFAVALLICEFIFIMPVWFDLIIALIVPIIIYWFIFNARESYLQ